MSMVCSAMPKVKTIFITGATSGVGYALTKRLLSEVHRVWATGRSTGPLKQLQAEGAKIIQVDLSNRKEMDRLLLTIETPDVVIFSAGIGTFSYAYDATDEMIESIMDVNVVVPMQLTRRLLPRMMKRKKGHLMYIGSQAGKVATPKASIYAASKHALIGYTNALRMELAPFNMHVTTIHPGPIDTPFLDLADRSGKYRTSVGRHLLTVQTVVDAILRAIEKPVREVNLPWYMGITSKLYALMPSFIERVGRKFFYKKD